MSRIVNNLNLFVDNPELLDKREYSVKSQVPQEIFRDFVKYVEGAEVAITERNSCFLLLLSKEFGFTHLQSVCEDFLANQQSTINSRLAQVEKQVLRAEQNITRTSGQFTMCTNEFSSIKTDIASVRESIESEDFYERGLELIYGDHDVPKEVSQGLRLLKKSADLHHPEAAFEYAIHLSTGDVCDKDVIAAAKYFKLSADVGNSDGQFHFGICLSEGIGVGQDLAQSANYFKLSADDGNSNGQYHYGLALINGRGIRRDDGEGRRYLILSAEQGNSAAREFLRHA
jgi:hypothetical protein